MDLFIKLQENHQRIDAQNAARKAAIEAAYAEENQDLPPNVDCMGRMHAPCDGYVDIETDRIYGKGQFIPYPPFEFDEQDDFYKSYPCGSYSNMFKQRVKARTNVVKHLIDNGDAIKGFGLVVGNGKAWEQQGVEVCYLYVEAKYRSDLAIICEFCNADIDDATPAEEVVEYKPAPTGRIVVTGTVLATKTQEGYYGYEEKMLVLSDDMYKVWLTVPAAISGVEREQRVQFTATVEPSKDDRTFAFGKRPSKASVLEA